MASGKTDLSDLFAAHRGIISDRVTERKKSASLLRDLLDSNPIVDYIEACSSGYTTVKGKQRSGSGGGGGGQSLTWSSLFRNIVEYVMREVDAVAKMEEKARSMSTIQSRKKDPSDMLRAYIRASSKRGHHMNVGEVVEHILTILKSTKTIGWLCGDYSVILLHYILHKPHYVVRISSTVWNELITQYTTLYLSSSTSSSLSVVQDLSVFSRVLLSLLSLSSAQFDTNPATLFSFFSRAMLKIGNEKKPKIQENLLHSFSCYCSTAGYDSRGRLCKLGESMMASLLPLWGHCLPAVEAQLVAILRFQVKIHHPCGAHSDSCGGWAVNDRQWKKHLEELYELIMTDIESSSHKLQLSSGKGESGLKSGLIDLAADVINQVMYIRNEREDRTLTEPPSSGGGHQPRGKRMKMGTCWSRLRDGLCGSIDNPSFITWLQLITWLVAKWPGTLSSGEEEGRCLLSQLTKILQDTKRSDCLPWLFTCLNVLALHSSSTTYHRSPPSTALSLSHPHSSSSSSSASTSSRPTARREESWDKVWFASLKSMSVRNAEEEGYCLLIALVEQRLIEVDREMWKLMNQTVNYPRRPLVLFLASLIAHNHLPESLGPLSPPPPPPPLSSPSSSSSSSSHRTLWTYPLRVQLLNFLVPCGGGEEDDGRGGGGGGGGHGIREIMAPLSNSPFDTLSHRATASLCAHCLVALTQRSCSALTHHSYSLEMTSCMRERVYSLLGFLQTTAEQQWNDIEKIYLESTFHKPIIEVGRGGDEEEEPVVYPRESPIPSLLSLLIELLGNRAEKLLRSPHSIEGALSIREKIQLLAVSMETQAYHAAVSVNVLYLVGVVGGWSLGETMRKSLAIKLLPSLLQRIAAGLVDPLWNEVERSEYNQTLISILDTLIPMISFCEKPSSLECIDSFELVREVLLVSVPPSLLSVCLKIALRKPPLPLHLPSRISSTFSLATSSSSTTATTHQQQQHHPSSLSSSSTTASPSPMSSSSPSPSLPASSTFEEDMEIGGSITDSDPAMLGNVISQPGIKDFLLPGNQASCRIEAVCFVIRWYQLTTVAPEREGEMGRNEPQPSNSEERFEPKEAIIRILDKSGITKPSDIKVMFEICTQLASCESMPGEFLEGIMQMLSQVLSEHQSSQSVLCDSLKLLERLAPHFERGKRKIEEEEDEKEEEERRLGKEDYSSTGSYECLTTFLSAFWSKYYQERSLCGPVRLQLASTLRAFLATPGCHDIVLSISVRKRKKSDKKESSTVKYPLHEALNFMINDPCHAVRMHMAKVATALHRVAGSNELLPREQQLEVFHGVMDMLRSAHLISLDQDALSQEDDSVNRVASMIATLQYQACSSPSCEVAAVSELVQGVGQGFIDEQLASQALYQISVFLGYPNTARFLDDHLLSSLSSWLDKDLSLERYPYQLFGTSTQTDFFQEHADAIAPLLVYRCDEKVLGTFSSFLPSDSSLSSVLSGTLPSSMALILPSFARQGTLDTEAGSEERCTKARASHALLAKHLSEEEIGECMKTKMADFVVCLLLRMMEPHNASSRLARYSRASDPEPVSPHFSSVAVRATLDYLASCYGNSTAGHTSSFMKQLTRKQDNVQKVLLALAVAMETTHRPFRRRQLLQSYALFVTLVSDQLTQGLEGVASFVVMDIVHTVVRLLEHEAEKMSWDGRGGRGRRRGVGGGGRRGGRGGGGRGRTGKEGGGGGGGGEVEELTVSLCFHVLTTLSKAAIESYPNELGEHLQVVIATLVTFATCSKTNLKKQALQLLNLLLLSPASSSALVNHLSRLDPLPVTHDNSFHKFHELQQLLRASDKQNSLDQEIDRFIRAGESQPISKRGPGLRRLRELIRDRHGNVVELLHTSNEECSILRLIKSLVGVAYRNFGAVSTVVMEMGRCLGELGGMDLNCIALPASQPPGSFDLTSLPNSWSPIICYTAHIFFLLTSLLRDRNIWVVKACSECLPRVLATKTGAAVLSKMEGMFDWVSYLHPFKTTKKGALAAGLIAEAPPTNPTSIDAPSLWIPQYCHGDRGRESSIAAATVHERWITSLVTSLLDCGGVTDPVLLLVKPVCLVKVSFCESLFPYLILTLLWDHEDDFRPIISRHFRDFFKAAANSPSPRPSPFSSSATSISPSPSTSSQCSLTPPPPSVSTVIMINTIMFLRTQNRPKLKKSTTWDNNFWLDLDFLDVAMAAQRCSAYFTSLLYVEIWHGATKCDSMKGVANDSVPMETITTTTTPTTMETGQTGSEEYSVHQLLLEAYSNIGEPDSLYGVSASQSVSMETWMRLYEHEGEWDKSLSAYNLSMNLPGSSCQANLVGSLQNLGLTHVLNMYLTGVGVVSPQSMSGLSRFQYEAAWRCSIWEDKNINMLAQSGGYTGYHRNLCDSLMALRDGEPTLLSSSISSAREEVLGSLCGGSQEGCEKIYRCLSQLLCLCELEEAGELSKNSLSDTLLPFLDLWTSRLKCLDADFVYLEPVLSLRVSTLHSLIQREKSNKGGRGGGEEGRQRVEQLFVSLCDTLLLLAKRAQDEGRYQVAEGALFALNHIHNSRSSYSVSESFYPSLPWKHRLQEAKLHWGRGETNLALGQLRSLVQNLKTISDPKEEVLSLYPSALCLYGNWLGKTHSVNPTVIMKQYLELSVQLMEKERGSDVGPLLNAYLMLARYADSQYQRVTRHMTSLTYETKRQLLEKSQLELRKLTETMSAEARTRNRHTRTLMAQIEEDEIAMSCLKEDRQEFLEKALYNYIQCLSTGDEHDLRVFRLCALWFANASDTKINTIIAEGSARLESRKFLPLLYQLAARISARSLATDPFQHTLQEIIFRTSVDHPHQSLYVTLALSHASMDETFPASGHVTGHVTGTKTSRSAGRQAKKTSTTTSTVDEDKVKAAKDLIRRLHSQEPSLVHSMEQLCEAYIDLAYHDVSAHKKERKPIRFPASCTLIKLSDKLKEVAVPTIEIPVDPTCAYNDLVTIEGFDNHFSLAGGINLPKVLSCKCSDGQRRRQLVKGKDDLRQDAVMQQVFVLVNQLLLKEKSTSKRNLNIRTYKVVPLSQRSGIVEWCEGTTPLGVYLVGPQGKPFQGAHNRYRPQDWMSIECRKKLMDAGSKKGGKSKLATYAEITCNFRPVFHHFFTEHFANPSEWFERRLMYTRSVATSSIVGYVVGLGDRHVQNILIDTNTAEFIHIDLGVAFEQGRTLPTPETVPFRLTRDVVDGMGVAGVEGVFRRCCEKTMEVMRASHEELRTIVEVLLYDPLYLWTISPVKALHLQRRDESTASTGATGDQFFIGGTGGPPAGVIENGSNPTNKMAERVLLRLQEKLEGIEDGVPLSVDGQVNQLIQEATDPSNLCVLFPGWQPWI